MRRILTILLLGLSSAGCAAKGALKLDCADFAAFVHPIELTPLERQIRALDLETLPPAERELADRARRGRDRAACVAIPPSSPHPPAPERPLLLLSGGGQWGRSAWG